MNIDFFTRALNIFIRVFIVVFAFTMDVKVKADSVRIPHSENIASFDPSSIKTERSDHSFDFFKGRGFFLIHRENSALVFHTPHCILTSESGQFTVEVTDLKTSVNVISGSVTLKDRAAQKETVVKAGFSYWMGGLLSQGAHAHPATLEAYDKEHVRSLLKWLSPWGEKEVDSRLLSEEHEWKNAVHTVAEQNQALVNEDFAKVRAYLENEEKKQEARRRERLRVQNLFRARALGWPDENKQSPWASPRAPASDETLEDTEHN